MLSNTGWNVVLSLEEGLCLLQEEHIKLLAHEIRVDGTRSIVKVWKIYN